MSERAPTPIARARELGPGQIALSVAFANAHTERLRYCEALGGWLAWDGTRWCRDKVGTAQEDAKRWLAARARGVKGKEAEKLCSSASVRALLGLAKSDPGLARDPGAFDASPHELNTPGGIVDLRTGALRAHAFDAVTRVTSCVPDATRPPVRFLRFLEEVQPDPEVRAYIQRVFGYAATGSANEHALPTCHGRGANGKSVLVETLTGALGDYAAPGATSLVVETKGTHPTDVADLRGLRCVYVSETDGAARLDAAKVKSITGGEKLKARFMREDFFSFPPTHTLILITNHRPLVDASDDAIWRRLQLVPFNETIPAERQERGLAERLVAEEGPAILAWILEGSRAWYEGGLRPPSAIVEVSRGYRLAEDIVGRFVQERCDTGPTLWEVPAQLLAAFQRFAREEGEERRVSGRDFATALERKGFPSTRSDSTRKRRGLSLRPEYRPSANDEDDPYA